SNPAASATPMAGSAASNPAGGTFVAPDSADSSSPSNVLFESTSGGILDFFFLTMMRKKGLGKSISGDGVVFVDKLPDDEIVDPRVKVETITESAASQNEAEDVKLLWMKGKTASTRVFTIREILDIQHKTHKTRTKHG
ncbi:hypothetical protein Tco_0125247, partial [Tanacetum coccineum]